MSFVKFAQIWTILLYAVFWIYAACLSRLVVGRATVSGILVAGLALTCFPGTHIALSYELGRNKDGVKVNPPKPKGMSGGGLWIVPNSFEPNRIFLAGILIEHHGKVVLATRIESVVRFVREYAL